MEGTFSQIHIHTVFAVKNRACFIGEEWEEELFDYISGIVQENRHKLLAINGVPDHIHLFMGFRPHQSLGDLMRMVKGSSSNWINHRNFIPQKFAWQTGYGAFSHSRSQVDRVIDYIKNQKVRHRKCSFKEEYQKILDSFDVQYDPKHFKE